MTAETDAAMHEELLVKSFVKKVHRERLSFELSKRRGDFLNRFCHESLKYLDSRFVVAIPKPNSNPAEILQLLKSHRAKDRCYALSMNDDIDGKFLALADALDVALGFGLPSILSCIPGQLAYLETEQIAGSPDRFILCRSPT